MESIIGRPPEQSCKRLHARPEFRLAVFALC